jgi:hypothetical protein
MDRFKLPSAFADLEPLAARWGRASENERSRIRWSATAEEFATFYNAVMPRLDEILAFLTKNSVTGRMEEVQNLFDFACAFAEASPHHELYKGSARVPYSFDAHRFVAAHGDDVTRELLA